MQTPFCILARRQDQTKNAVPRGAMLNKLSIASPLGVALPIASFRGLAKPFWHGVRSAVTFQYDNMPPHASTGFRQPSFGLYSVSGSVGANSTRTSYLKPNDLTTTSNARGSPCGQASQMVCMAASACYQVVYPTSRDAASHSPGDRRSTRQRGMQDVSSFSAKRLSPSEPFIQADSTDQVLSQHPRYGEHCAGGQCLSVRQRARFSVGGENNDGAVTS